MKKLPLPKTSGLLSVEEAIHKRRSVRSFTNKPLAEEQISQLLYAGQGITNPDNGFRSSPSAGATYPLELYVFTEKGIFKYIPDQHCLEVIQQQDLRSSLAKAALNQNFIKQAPAVFVITAVFKRTTQKYGSRGLKYVYMEAGHVAQNIHLQAIALNLNSVSTGAFYDEEVKSLLKCSDNEIPIYIIPVGQRKL